MIFLSLLFVDRAPHFSGQPRGGPACLRALVPACPCLSRPWTGDDRRMATARRRWRMGGKPRAPSAIAVLVLTLPAPRLLLPPAHSTLSPLAPVQNLARASSPPRATVASSPLLHSRPIPRGPYSAVTRSISCSLPQPPTSR
jgi:hypothetical protein